MEKMSIGLGLGVRVGVTLTCMEEMLEMPQ
jgi:hypothetical protein